jgi:hypothetical protein
VFATCFACATGTPAEARQPKAKAKSATEVIELELREISGGRTRSTHFVVPLDGGIAGWTELLGARHYCRAEAGEGAEQRVRVDLRCARSETSKAWVFRVWNQRVLAPGEAVLIAELTPPELERVEVVATRR